MAADRMSKDHIISAFHEALSAGTAAGSARIRELAARPNSQEMFLENCGGSVLRLCVDGRSAAGRILANLEGPGFSVKKFHDGGFIAFLRYSLVLLPPVNGQEFSIDCAADGAAASVLERQLGIRAYSQQFID